MAGLARVLARGLLRLTVTGAENVPAAGAVLLTMNHLGGVDPVVVLGLRRGGCWPSARLKRCAGR